MKSLNFFPWEVKSLNSDPPDTRGGSLYIRGAPDGTRPQKSESESMMYLMSASCPRTCRRWCVVLVPFRSVRVELLPAVYHSNRALAWHALWSVCVGH